eukprot:5344410-Pyramimonas_sp.AAC.1
MAHTGNPNSRSRDASGPGRPHGLPRGPQPQRASGPRGPHEPRRDHTIRDHRLRASLPVFSRQVSWVSFLDGLVEIRVTSIIVRRSRLGEGPEVTAGLAPLTTSR